VKRSGILDAKKRLLPAAIHDADAGVWSTSVSKNTLQIATKEPTKKQ